MAPRVFVVAICLPIAWFSSLLEVGMLEPVGRPRVDSLTGLLAGVEQCAGVLRGFVREGPVGFVELDIDRLQEINRRLGYEEADRELQRVAKTLEEQTPKPGVCFRVGSDDFGVALPGYDLSGVVTVARRLRDAVRELGLPGPAEGEVLTVRAVGVAAPQGADVDEIFVPPGAVKQMMKGPRAYVMATDVLGGWIHLENFVITRDSTELLNLGEKWRGIIP